MQIPDTLTFDKSVTFGSLHLETGVIFFFLMTVIWNQFARSREQVALTQHAKVQTFALITLGAALTALFGYSLTSFSPLLAVELAVGVTLSLLHPMNALCFFIHMLILRPWEVIPPIPSLLSIPILLAGTCIISGILHPEALAKPTAFVYKVLALLLGFSVWLFLTTFKAPNISGTQSNWFQVYFHSLFVFVMCLFFIENRRSLIELRQTIVVSVLGIAVVGLLSQVLFNPLDRLRGIRLAGETSLGNSNDVAAIMVLALPFVAAPLLDSEYSFVARLAGLIFSAISVWAIWLTRSRGALLALMVQIFCMQYLRDFPKKRYQALLVSVLLGFAYVGLVKVIPREAGDMEISKESRLIYWKTATTMVRQHPLAGVGYAQFPELYEVYSPAFKYERGKRAAHSSWFLVFAESGVVGGLLYVTFFGTILRTAWRHRVQMPDQLYALVGYGVAMSFLSHTYWLYPFLLAALVLASDSIRQHSEGR